MGSMGTAVGRGSEGQGRLKLKSFKRIDVQLKWQNCHNFCVSVNSVKHFYSECVMQTILYSMVYAMSDVTLMQSFLMVTSRPK